LYPNPVQNQLVAQLNSLNTGARLVIYNAAGIMVFSRALNTATTSIPLENLAAGIYYVQVSNGPSGITKIVVKE